MPTPEGHNGPTPEERDQVLANEDERQELIAKPKDERQALIDEIMQRAATDPESFGGAGIGWPE